MKTHHWLAVFLGIVSLLTGCAPEGDEPLTTIGKPTDSALAFSSSFACSDLSWKSGEGVLAGIQLYESLVAVGELTMTLESACTTTSRSTPVVEGETTMTLAAPVGAECGLEIRLEAPAFNVRCRSNASANECICPEAPDGTGTTATEPAM